MHGNNADSIIQQLTEAGWTKDSEGVWSPPSPKTQDRLTQESVYWVTGEIKGIKTKKIGNLTKVVITHEIRDEHIAKGR